jgi:hypothetical protein
MADQSSAQASQVNPAKGAWPGRREASGSGTAARLCARALLHRPPAAGPRHLIRPCRQAGGQRRGCLQVRWITPHRRRLRDLLMSSEDRSCLGYRRVAAIDDEQQDGRVVEPARCCRAGHDLRCTPGNKGEDGHEPQEAMRTAGRPADTDGGNGGRDEEQRGG